jgi:hypothetical protein
MRHRGYAAAMKKLISDAKRSASKAATAAGNFLLSPMLWLFLFFFAGAGAVSAGVFVQYGLGFALICAGLFSIVLAAIIFRGLRNG